MENCQAGGLMIPYLISTQTFFSLGGHRCGAAIFHFASHDVLYASSAGGMNRLEVSDVKRVDDSLPSALRSVEKLTKFTGAQLEDLYWLFHDGRIKGTFSRDWLVRTMSSA
jgi:hypothetical protein